jgi:hypothetical protein
MRYTLAAAALLASLAVAGSAQATVRAARWPASFEHAFLVNCNATSHGQIARCRCELQSLERHYTYRTLASIYLHDQTRLRAILLRTARGCSD